jgi:integrase
MASIQTRHSRECPLTPWTTFEQATDGCICKPTYYVIVREGKKLHRERVGKNRKDAERALRKIGTAVDDGAYRPQLNSTFEAWADRWLAALEVKPGTKKSYRATMTVSKRLFGTKEVRRLTTADVGALNEHLRETGATPSTRVRHLRALHTCLESAIAHGYAATNVVKSLPKGEKPKKSRREAGYFTDDEIPVLFAHVDDGVYRILFELALKTGARLGELCALTWADVDLTDALIHIRRTFTDGHLGEAKTETSQRTIDVNDDVVELLGAWWGELDRPDDTTLVLPGPTLSGYLPNRAVLRELYAAMAAAEIPREGPNGEKRTFHSWRHTFARIALEHGAELTWLSRHLGHSSTMVTDVVYGHWSRASRKAQTEKLAGAFGV